MTESHGFLSLGNNNKIAQFLDRSGSYSTHAKRNGVSLLYDFDLPDDQLSTDIERLDVLRKTYAAKCEEIKNVKKELGIGSDIQISQFLRVAKRGIFNNSVSQSKKVIYGCQLADEATGLRDEIATLKIKVRNSRPKSDFFRFLMDAMKEHLSPEMMERIHETARQKMRDVR